VSLTRAIKEQAYVLGFSLVGVTTPEPLPHMDVFKVWLQQGRHGEMTYLNSPRSRECRNRPDLILPGCRSVISLGINYPVHPLPVIDTREEQPRGRIAAYAWGTDYHTTLPERLRSLVMFIETQVRQPIPNRWYTDTGPLLEHELAQRAGLGWIGKNTCLINPRQGSYFLLAEILLGIELEPDPPFTRDACGTCSRCITACPTSCILPNRTLDARRCISYLTIELKGSIPREVRPFVGPWVFGCDVCQQVCPWNRFATPQLDQVFTHRMANHEPNLLEEMALSPGDFKQKYSHTPLARAKRKGYLRNIAVALGNLHKSEAVPVLVQALLFDPEPLVRAHAAWALGQIGDAPAKQALDKAVVTESDFSVMSEIQASLGG
jgi:epoxyqueuosine reductase